MVHVLHAPQGAAQVCSAKVNTAACAGGAASLWQQLHTVLVSLHRVDSSAILDAAVRHNAL